MATIKYKNGSVWASVSFDDYVKKTGDTMTGDLYIDKSNPKVRFVHGGQQYRLQADGSEDKITQFGFFKHDDLDWKLWMNSEDHLRLRNPLDIVSGGTGSASSQEALTTLGAFNCRNTDEKNNVTGGKAKDTRAFWQEQPPGAYYFNETNMLKAQPNQYGTLLHFKRGGSVMQQIFLPNASNIWVRFCNGSQDFVDTQKTAGGWYSLL